MSVLKLPSFFKDQSKSYKYEELIDYFISWTIRCSDLIYENNGLINKYSKKILSKLIFDDEKVLDSKRIKNVQVWKQSDNIDLWIELEIENDPQKIVLIIESKMYSSIRDNQLKKYKTFIENYYSDRKDYKLNFVLLRPDYEHDYEKDFCYEQGFLHINIEELQELLNEGETGNYLFDEFWFNW